MVESVDGRIDCHMVDKISGDEYYTTLDALGCHASVEGRVTMERYYAAPGRFSCADPVPAGRPGVFRATDRTDLHICPDTRGTLLWDGPVTDGGRPLLILTSEQAPEAYLEYLRGKNISYIVGGKGTIDLAGAMRVLYGTFGVERLAVLGGGLINGAFLSAGLLDELSLLLAPGIDGREGQRALFDGVHRPDGQPTVLRLQSVERVGHNSDVLWLRYRV